MEESSRDFISALFKDSWEWASDKETRALAVLALEDIFRNNKICSDIDKNALLECCRSLTEIMICEIECPSNIENMQYEKEKMLTIASRLNLIKDNNLNY